MNKEETKKFSHMEIFLSCLKKNLVSFRMGKNNHLLKNQPMLCLVDRKGIYCTEKHCKQIWNRTNNIPREF